MKHFMPTPNVIEAAVQVSDVSDLTAQDLIATCIDRLGKFKALDHIHFLQELPKAPLKIKRKASGPYGCRHTAPLVRAQTTV
jgi:hypothetical protein